MMSQPDMSDILAQAQEMQAKLQAAQEEIYVVHCDWAGWQWSGVGVDAGFRVLSRR